MYSHVYFFFSIYLYLSILRKSMKRNEVVQFDLNTFLLALLYTFITYKTLYPTIERMQMASNTHSNAYVLIV